MPILKRKTDQEELVKAATSGNNKFFLGTDNAPHLDKNKISNCGCAGIFNSPVAVEMITQLFDKHNCLDKLEGFISTHGCDFYGLSYSNSYITLEKKSWTVDFKFDIPLTSLHQDKTLEWMIKKL